MKQHPEEAKQASKQPSVVSQKEPKVTKNETSTEKVKTEPAPKSSVTAVVAEPKLSESPKGDWKATLKDYNLQEEAAIEGSFIFNRELLKD